MNALILVDLQNDFTPATDEKPEGSLSVPDGNAVVPIVNQLLDHFDLVVATQDWHPPGHLSFASEHPGHDAFSVTQIGGSSRTLWPDHCVQGTEGAALLSDLNTNRIDHVVRKGTDRRVDSYSGFYDNDHRRATGLASYLNDRGVTRVHLCGLATDVCVKYTVLDAVKLGYETSVIRDACRGVEMQAGDCDRAFAAMSDAGAKLTNSREVVRQ